MDKRHKKYIFGVKILLILFFIFQAGAALAALEVPLPPLFGSSVNDQSTLPDYAKYFFNALINIAIIASVISVAFGGLYYLVSFARGKFTSEAKTWIKSGLLGLFIALSAYLIAYTINPSLLTFRLDQLPSLPFQNPFISGPQTFGGKTYQEIPIGKLTENLLTKTIACYDFDQAGNIIEGEEIKTDSGEKVKRPTYSNQDVQACLSKLIEGAQKVSRETANLSASLTGLMKQCKCSEATCEASGGAGACTPKSGVADCCPSGVKDRIEHGMVELAKDLPVCSTPTTGSVTPPTPTNSGPVLLTESGPYGTGQYAADVNGKFVLSQDGKYAYAVANWRIYKYDALNLEKGPIDSSAPVTNQPGGYKQVFTLSPDGNYLYILHESQTPGWGGSTNYLYTIKKISTNNLSSPIDSTKIDDYDIQYLGSLKLMTNGNYVYNFNGGIQRLNANNLSSGVIESVSIPTANASFSADGNSLYVINGQFVGRLNPSNLKAGMVDSYKLKGYGKSLAPSPDGKYLYVGLSSYVTTNYSSIGTIETYDASNLARGPMSFSGPVDSTSKLVLSNDGKCLYAAASNYYTGAEIIEFNAADPLNLQRTSYVPNPSVGDIYVSSINGFIYNSSESAYNGFSGHGMPIRVFGFSACRAANGNNDQCIPNPGFLVAPRKCNLCLGAPPKYLTVTLGNGFNNPGCDPSNTTGCGLLNNKTVTLEQDSLDPCVWKGNVQLPTNANTCFAGPADGTKPIQITAGLGWLPTYNFGQFAHDIRYGLSYQQFHLKGTSISAGGSGGFGGFGGSESTYNIDGNRVLGLPVQNCSKALTYSSADFPSVSGWNLTCNMPPKNNIFKVSPLTNSEPSPVSPPTPPNTPPSSPYPLCCSNHSAQLCPSGKSGDCCSDGSNYDASKCTVATSPYSVCEPFKISQTSVTKVSQTKYSGPESKYLGLDEFRWPVPMDMPNKVSIQCKQIAGAAADSKISDLVEKTYKVNKEDVVIIDKDKWDCLTLIQKLAYFKEKVSTFKEVIKKDSDKLKEATDALSKCYLAISYVDLLKARQGTSIDKAAINIEKPFKDPSTEKSIEISKYCGGFNYGQSNALKKCNDVCPDSSQEVLDCYKQKCSACSPGDTACQSTQKSCVEKCFNERPCLFSNGLYSSFENCMDKSKDECNENCSDRYSTDSNLYKVCNDLCNNSEKCVIDNKGSCLFNSDSMVSAANQATNQEDAKDKISSAYLCKNGSDQYSAYPECVNTQASKDECKITPEQYTSSQLFIDPKNCQRCPVPFGTTAGNSAACLDVYPETEKCLSNSSCPNCPCGKIDSTYQFIIPAGSGVSSPSNGLQELKDIRIGCDYENTPVAIKAYELTSPQCNEYSFNDDPLTFYCENQWWDSPYKEGQNSQPIGASKACSQKKEIPVGQAVDKAQQWAKSLMDVADGMDKDIQAVIDSTKKAAYAYKDENVKDYCKCGAKSETGSPICKPVCDSEVILPPLDSCEIPAPSANYLGEYWNWGSGASNIPTTNPVISRNDSAIDFDWGLGSPGSGINVDRFVVRWTKTTFFAPGKYLFTTTADDGIRFYLDNNLIIDKWFDQGPTTYTASLNISGNHTIRVEYYENGAGALAKFKYELLPSTPIANSLSNGVVAIGPTGMYPYIVTLSSVGGGLISEATPHSNNPIISFFNHIKTFFVDTILAAILPAEQNNDIAFVFNLGDSTMQKFYANSLVSGPLKTVTINGSSYDFATSTDGNYIYVITSNQMLYKYNTSDLSVAASVSTGGFPYKVVATNDGVYVINSNGSIKNFDPNSLSLLQSYNLETGIYPSHLAVSNNGNYLYIGSYHYNYTTNVSDSVVQKFNTNNLTVGPISSWTTPRDTFIDDLQVSADGSSLWYLATTWNMADFTRQQFIHKLDANNLLLGPTVGGIWYIDEADNIYDIAVSPNKKSLYASGWSYHAPSSSYIPIIYRFDATNLVIADSSTISGNFEITDISTALDGNALFVVGADGNNNVNNIQRFNITENENTPALSQAERPLATTLPQTTSSSDTIMTNIYTYASAVLALSTPESSKSTLLSVNLAQHPFEAILAQSSTSQSSSTSTTCSQKCSGDSCQQIINYLPAVWSANRTMEINSLGLYLGLLQDNIRSDALKQLTYSRQQTNNCSSVQNNDDQTRMLSCTRIENELIPPINSDGYTYGGKVYNSYCYGKELGKIVDAQTCGTKPSVDNWFCCE